MSNSLIDMCRDLGRHVLSGSTARAMLVGGLVAIAGTPVQASLFLPGSDATLIPGRDCFCVIGSTTSTQSKWEPGVGTASFGLGTFGLPGEATWSIMGAGLGDVSGFDSVHPASTVDIATLLPLSTIVAAIEGAMDVWAAVSGFGNLGQVTDGGGGIGATGAAGGVGDIRVAGIEISTTGVLAHTFQPGTDAIFGPAGGIAGDIHFDESRSWVDNPADTPFNSDFDFFTVALHEVGHALGLAHTDVVGSVMEPIYAGARRELGLDDIAGIQFIYGPGSAQQFASVPEPTTGGILVAGLLGLVLARRRRGS